MIDRPGLDTSVDVFSLRFRRPTGLCFSAGLLFFAACESSSSASHKDASSESTKDPDTSSTGPEGGETSNDGDSSGTASGPSDTDSTSSSTGAASSSEKEQDSTSSDTDSTSSSDNQSTEIHPGKLPEKEDPADFEQLRSDKERDDNPDVGIEVLRTMRAGNNNLGFELQRLRAFGDSENGAISPVSVHLALGQVHAAARGETQSELQKALGYHVDPQKTHAALNRMSMQLASLEEEKKESQEPVFVRIANSSFFRPGTQVGKTYLDTLATQYGAGVYRANFSKDPQDVTDKINGWVSKITREKIPELFPDGALTVRTVWAFANAIYFKAPWRLEFFERETKPADFTKLNGEKSKVQMMRSLQDRARFGQDDQSSWAQIQLGYQGALAAIFVLPKKGYFSKVEQSMSNERLDAMLNASKFSPVDLRLPKFKLSTGSMLMNDSFKKLGVEKLFDDADLSGISDDGKNSLPGLKVLFHSVFVAMDERGVEAAAATGGGADDSVPKDIKHMVLNRPFLFMIYDYRSGLVLFNGRVVDPKWD